MPKRILLVDDSRAIRLFCRGIAEKAGYEVVEAWDIAQVRSTLESQEIALMLCDLNLPGMDGLALIERIRKNPKYVSLPVAVLTGEFSAALVERAKQAGVSAWLRKPCRPEQLMGVISKIAGAP